MANRQVSFQLLADRCRLETELKSCEQVYEAIASTRENFAGISSDPRGMFTASWDFQADARKIDELEFKDESIQEASHKIANSMNFLASSVQAIDKLPQGNPERIQFFSDQVMGSGTQLIGISKQEAALRKLCSKK